MYIWLFNGVIAPDSGLPLRLASMSAGSAVLAIGMALVIKSDAGTGANDLIAVIIADRLKKRQFRWVRMKVDAFLTLLGFIMGGVIGIGTLAAVLIVGPVAQAFFPLMDSLVSRVAEKAW